jgi:hypothetical protein
MSHTAPAEAVQPDPHRAVSARPGPAGVGNILRLLHTLIAYGRNVVQTLRETDDPKTLPWFAVLTRIFDTTNPALITVYMIRGLLRAVALQARLGKGLASLSTLSSPQNRAAERTDAESAPSRAPAPRRPPAIGWRTFPPGWPAYDSALDRLPTPEEQMYAEIVAEDHDRDIGPILFDICVDLGIVPAQMDPATWDALRRAIALHGADPAPFEARHLDLADPAPADAAPVGRKSEAHSATPAPTDNPDVTPIAYPPLAGATPSLLGSYLHRPSLNPPPVGSDH